MTATTREAVERLASHLQDNSERGAFNGVAGLYEAAATLRALLAERDAARAKALEDAALWHEAEANLSQKLAQRRVSEQDAREWQITADYHRDCAAAIRALSGAADA